VCPQYRADLGGDRARPGCNVGPAVPERHDTIDGGGVVPVTVEPAFFRRMRGRTIKLHGHAVLPVQHIPVQDVTTAYHPGLPDRQGQAVRALHATEVTTFKPGMRSASHIAEGLGEFAAPAELLARLHRRPEPLRRRMPAAPRPPPAG
jgi:hypothetical protein